MPTHQGLPVEGYREQGEDKIALVNINKGFEELVLRHLDNLAKVPSDLIDKRWLAIGRTGIEQAFMAINRAIFQPGRISLPEDNQ